MNTHLKVKDVWPDLYFFFLLEPTKLSVEGPLDAHFASLSHGALSIFGQDSLGSISLALQDIWHEQVSKKKSKCVNKLAKVSIGSQDQCLISSHALAHWPLGASHLESCLRGIKPFSLKTKFWLVKNVKT